nr:RNA-directed DNA polymerase, eukaryota, reverse transcriptase zinc-binding domain protein [Tanacetum cinerariifolium]
MISFKSKFPHIYLLDNNQDCYVANGVLIHEWSAVLRRHPRGGVKSSQLESIHAAIGNVVLTDQHDSWTWSLDVSLGFSVAFVRSLVDAYTLYVDSNATRWIRCIPIKINVFLWRLSLNKFPSRVNLDLKSIDVGSLLCPICQEDVESVNHIFFSCEMAKVLWDLFAKLKIFSGKLKSRWSGPFTISHVFPYGTVELTQPNGPNFKVNGYHLKHYFGEDLPKLVVPNLQTFANDH